MSDFITLACPSCAGELKVTADMDRFACKHCGREHLVRRQAAAAGQAAHVELMPVVKHLEKMNRTMDRQASELAIRRLRTDRKTLKSKLEDWRRELWHAKNDVRSCNLNMILTGGGAASVSIAALVIVIASRNLACLSVGLLFVVVAPLGLLAALRYRRLGRFRSVMENAKKRLNSIRDQLDECEEELDFHEGVVRR